jgi:hypothetical protein
MRPRGMTLAEVHKGYRDDDCDGDDSLSQRQQQQQAPQLSQERQLLQAAAMIHTALMLVSGVAGVPLPNLQQSRRQSQRQPSRFWYEKMPTLGKLWCARGQQPGRRWFGCAISSHRLLLSLCYRWHTGTAGPVRLYSCTTTTARGYIVQIDNTAALSHQSQCIGRPTGTAGPVRLYSCTIW